MEAAVAETPATTTEAAPTSPAPDAQSTVEGQPTGEPAKTETPAEKATRRFEAAARREAAAEARERAIQERWAKVESYENLSKGFVENPMALLEHLGVTMEQLVDHAIKSVAPKGGGTGALDQASVEKLVAEKIEATRRAMEAEHQTQSQARELAQWESRVASHIAQDPERAEFFSDSGVTPRDILEVIDYDFRQRGGPGKAQPMTIEQATEKVESFLVEKEKARVAKLQKMARFGAPKADSTKPAEVVPPTGSVSKADKGPGYETDLSGRIKVTPKVSRADDGKFTPRVIKRAR